MVGRAGLSPRALWGSALTLLALVVLSLLRLRQQAPPEAPQSADGVWQFEGESMGTTYQVRLRPPSKHDARPPPASLRAAIESALASVDGAMSTYKPASELSRFNESTSLEPVPVSKELRAVLEVAFAVGRASGGALDITVGPLVDAWGFGPGVPKPPSAQRLASLHAHVGLDKLELTAAGLAKRDPRVRCDLSAVAKGYAVDLVGARLAERGVTDYLVEVGGELLARGVRPDGTPWRVAVEQPLDSGRGIARVLALRDAGIATSGDYRNFRMEDGRRVSHLLDPRTGRPVAHGLASVSVIHARVAVADAWATALSVLGPEESLRVAEREDLMVMLIVRMPDGTFETRLSPTFLNHFGAE